MEKIEVKFDPLTGTYTHTGFVDDKLVIHKAADLAPVVNYTRALRNADEYTKNGIKNGFWHIAHIPEVLEVELLQNGIDVNRASIKDIVAMIKKLGKEHLCVTRGNV